MLESWNGKYIHSLTEKLRESFFLIFWDKMLKVKGLIYILWSVGSIIDFNSDKECGSCKNELCTSSNMSDVVWIRVDSSFSC